MDIRGFVGERCVFEVHTSFGIFPAAALAEQAGVKVTPAEQVRIAAPSGVDIDLKARPARFFEGPGGAPRLAGPMLLMLDRITALDPHGGPKGLGWARAEKLIDPAEWFFKAHFFQDPVQPGSLGLEGLLQLLQVVMIERGLGEGLEGARFEPIEIGRQLTWKYRGQVFPESTRTTMEIEIEEIGRDERGPCARAQGWLWVDGARVYHAIDLGMRIVCSAVKGNS
jgi:3-hydroxymyristoyl/3-hydroxydecanoyl-(acyl carrier protein) dehydratase